MKISKVKNMGKNIKSGIIYRFISIFFPFIIRTIIIHVLSNEYLGLSSLFTSILQALNLMEVGLGSSLVFNMYECVARNDIEKIGNYMSFYKKCYRIIGIIILVFGLLLLPFLDRFITGTYPADINIKVLYLIYLVNTVLSYLLFSYKNSIALAYQRTDIETNSMIFSQMFMFILQIIVLIVLKSYFVYAILMPVATILKNFMVSYSVDKRYPDIVVQGDISKEEKKKLVNNIKSLLGHQIAFTVINSADNIILSAFLGLSDLAIYNNYYYIMNAIISIMTIIFNSIQAGIGNQIIIDKKEKVYENYKRFRFFIYTIVTTFTICLFCMYQPFMEIWMGKNNLLPNFAVVVFSFGFYITQIRRVVTTYKNAAGLWKQDILKPYIWIIFDILLDIILIPRIGSTGAMCATLVSAIIVAIPVENYVLYKNVFNKNIIEQYKYMLKEIAILFSSLLLSYVIIINFVFRNIYFQFIFSFIVSIVVSAISIIIYRLNSKEIKWIWARTKLYFKYKK